MAASYSTYEAKARFSEILKQVREGRIVTVTYHGEPVAEIRPLDRNGGMAARLGWLRGRGVVAGRAPRVGRLVPVATRPGSLDRFLDERGA